MRIVIDIDGTICETKKPGQTYDQLRVNPGAVEKIKALKDAGHYIILHTARHMKSVGGDVAKVIEKIGKVTEDWLKENNIVYDEIHYGKPYNQVVIDDRGFVFEGWEDFKAEDFESEKVNILVFPGVSKDLETKLKTSFANATFFNVALSNNQLQTAIALEAHINNFQRVIAVTAENLTSIPSIENVEEENLEGLLTVAAGEGEGFVKNDEWGFVEEISNQPISTHGASGFYFFNNGRDFLSCAKAALRHGQNKVVDSYNQLIKRGQKVKSVKLSNVA